MEWYFFFLEEKAFNKVSFNGNKDQGKVLGSHPKGQHAEGCIVTTELKMFCLNTNVHTESACTPVLPPWTRFASHH